MNALLGLMDPREIGAGVQQAFQAGRAQRAETETRNALSQLVTDPMNTQSMATLARYSPQDAMAMQERQRGIQADEQKAQQQQMQQQLMRAAVGGDQAAMNELAVQNLDAWKTLGAEQRNQVKVETELFGNAAMDILNRPPEQRAQAVQAYAQQLGQQYPEVMQIAQLPPDQLEAALRSAIAEAGMVKQMIELERPDYMAIPAGGTLVDTRNPQAVQQFGEGPQPGAVEDGYRFRGGDPANPQNWEKVGGTAGNGGGGFPSDQ